MPYRLEVSANNRAGCQVKACKDDKIKIKTGELRQGTWADIPNGAGGTNGSWKWRHWGCVTPKIITNMKDATENLEDLSAIEGLTELPDDVQNKVLEALARGYVDDEDWKGDVKKNRPAGFKRNDEGEDEKKPAKKRSRKAADENDEDIDDDAPAPKRGRKKKVQETDEEAAPSKPSAGKPKGKRKTARDKAQEQQTDETNGKVEEAQTKPSKGRAKAKAMDGAADGDAAPANPPKRGRPARKAAPVVIEADEQEEGAREIEEQEVPAKKGRGRGRKKE